MSLLKQYALSLSLAPSLIAAANTCQRQLTEGLYWAHNAESTCSHAVLHAGKHGKRSCRGNCLLYGANQKADKAQAGSRLRSVNLKSISKALYL